MTDCHLHWIPHTLWPGICLVYLGYIAAAGRPNIGHFRIQSDHTYTVHRARAVNCFAVHRISHQRNNMSWPYDNVARCSWRCVIAVPQTTAATSASPFACLTPHYAAASSLFKCTQHTHICNRSTTRPRTRYAFIDDNSLATRNGL